MSMMSSISRRVPEPISTILLTYTKQSAVRWPVTSQAVLALEIAVWRMLRYSQVVGDAPEGITQLFWVGVGRRKKAVVFKFVLRFWRVLGNFYPSEGEIRLHAV